MADEMSALGRELFEIFRPVRLDAPLIEIDHSWLETEPITEAEIAAAHAAIKGPAGLASDREAFLREKELRQEDQDR